MKKLVLAAAAAATLALIVPASAQSVTIDSGMHRDRSAVVVHRDRGYHRGPIVVRSRAEYRPHRKVVIIKQNRGHHYGWNRSRHHNRTVVIER